MSVRSILINDKINSSLIPIKAGSNITLRYDTDGIRISSTGGGGGGGTLDEVLTAGNDAMNQAILNLSEINTVGPLELTCTNNLSLNADNNVIMSGTNTTITNTGTLTSNTLGNVQLTSSTGFINSNAVNINSTATGNNVLNGDAVSAIASKNITITSSTQDVNINALNDTISLNSADCIINLSGDIDITAVNGGAVYSGNVVTNSVNHTINDTGTFNVNSLGAINIASTIGSATFSGTNVNSNATGVNTVRGDSVNINTTDKDITLNSSEDVNIKALANIINLESVDLNLIQTGAIDAAGATVVISSTGVGGDITLASNDNIFATSVGNTNITSGTNTFINSTTGALNMSAGTNIIIGAIGATTIEGLTVDVEGSDNVLIKSNNQKVIVQALTNSIDFDCLDLNAIVTDFAKITAGESIEFKTLGVNKKIALVASGDNNIQGLNNVMESVNTTEIKSDNNILVKTNNANTSQGNIDIDSFRLIVSNNFVTNVPAGQDQGYIRTRLNGSVVNYGIPYFNIGSGFTMPTDGLLWTNPPTTPANYAKYLYNNSGVLEWRVAGGTAPFNNASILAMSPTYFWDFTDESRYTGISAGQILDQAFTNVLDLTSGKVFTNQGLLRTNRISNTGTLRMLSYLAGASGITISKTLAPQPANTNWCIIMAGMFCFDNTSPNNGVPMFVSYEGGSFYSRFFINDKSRWEYKNIGAASVFNVDGAMLLQQQPNKFFNTQIQSPFVFCMQNSTVTGNCRIFCNGQLSVSGTVANYPNPLTVDIAIGNLDPSSYAGFASLSHNSTTSGSLTHLLCLTGANSTDDNRQKIESYLMRVMTGSTWNLSPSNPYKMTPP